jgi:hypothetical protein
LYILASIPHCRIFEKKTTRFVSVDGIFSKILSPVATYYDALYFIQQSQTRRSVGIQTNSFWDSEIDVRFTEKHKTTKEPVYLGEPRDQQLLFRKPVITQRTTNISAGRSLTSAESAGNWRDKLKAKFGKCGKT